MLLLRATEAGPLGLATSTVGPCSVTTVTMQGPFTIVTVEADPVMGTVVINISAKRIHKDAQLCDNYIHGVALLLGSVNDGGHSQFLSIIIMFNHVQSNELVFLCFCYLKFNERKKKQ